MDFTAKTSFVRITPRKMGLLVDQVRGKSLNEALMYLRFSPRSRTATTISKLLKSAAANAASKGTVDVDQLFVKTIFVGNGPSLKRFMARAKGSASPILKRTSHLTVTLTER